MRIKNFKTTTFRKLDIKLEKTRDIRILDWLLHDACFALDKIRYSRKQLVIPDSSSTAVAEIPSVIQSLPENMNPELEMEMKRYQSSVANFGMAVLLSAVNVVLVVADADISFPFSAFFPTLIIIFGDQLAEESNLAIFSWIGIVLAVFSILIYAVCWFLSKKYRPFILVGFVIFILDFLLIFPFILGGSWEVLVEIVFHIWVLCTLYSGVKALRNIHRLDTDTIKQ